MFYGQSLQEINQILISGPIFQAKSPRQILAGSNQMHYSNNENMTPQGDAVFV